MNSLIKNVSVKPPLNIMLLTKSLERSPAGGREMLCKFNRDVLRDIYDQQFTEFEFIPRPIRGLTAIINSFRGHIDGLNNESIATALLKIREKKVTKLFVDGSNLGEIVKIVKKEYPYIQVCTFFHNVEARFFLGAFRQNKTYRALAILLVNYLSESKAVQFSDKIICLSERDSSLLHRIYGRSATHISPIALRDNLSLHINTGNDIQQEKFALFVGGSFYANVAGITWFVKNVVPRITIKTCIVGKGFEAVRDKLELPGKVEVVGEVESVADWYRKAHFVVAPIFDGSGMKTKVAEALMFGKKILGTPEAFTGYEAISNRAGCVCTTADDFVAAIEAADTIVRSSFDNELRVAYELTYSYAAARARLEAILSE
jgi:glycosyltransferase involved in cell wall biosynthesis